MSVHDEYDIFRHSTLRYLGYTNEIGEAFRYQLSFKALTGTYIIATLYVIGDALDKGYKAFVKYHKEELKTHERNLARKKAFKTVINVILWQMFSSELVPALCVFLIVRFSKKLKLAYITNTTIRKWIPTTLGLCAIPLFPFTVDPVVDKVFDKLNLSIDSNLH